MLQEEVTQEKNSSHWVHLRQDEKGGGREEIVIMTTTTTIIVMIKLMRMMRMMRKRTTKRERKQTFVKMRWGNSNTYQIVFIQLVVKTFLSLLFSIYPKAVYRLKMSLKKYQQFSKLNSFEILQKGVICLNIHRLECSFLRGKNGAHKYW